MSVEILDLPPLCAQPTPTGSSTGNSARIANDGLLTLPRNSHELEHTDDVIQSLLQTPCTTTTASVRKRFGSQSRSGSSVVEPANGAPGRAERLPARGRQVQALQKWRLKRVVDYIDARMSSKITLDDLAAIAGLSRMHFASQFRVATGRRPHEFVLLQRIRRAEELMRDTTTTIMEVALTVGFQTQAHFTTVFKRFTGHTPRRWRVIDRTPGPTDLKPVAA
jgi:AraC family transcriptional regulator